MIKVYGLKNCDTCRKALKWLEGEDVNFSFHDIRKETPDQDVISRWVSKIGWETLLNKRGTTWRGLSDDIKQVVGEAQAADLMAQHPALMKRPVFDFGEDVACGFSDDLRSLILQNQ